MLATNNKEFYPTPLHIINKMLEGIDFSTIETVLEPSAGSGHIAKIINDKMKYHDRSYDHYSNKSKQYHADIDCIEIDQNLRYILVGNGFRVVHDDFLTYNTMKNYSLVVMNPPFSNGDKHLLKAIEMQEKHGGIIVCLLNAETLKNDYSNARNELKQKLEEYNADIEYIENAFLDAERKTYVETALIKIHIEEREKYSFIFDELRQEEKHEYKTDNQSEYNFLAQNDFINTIVDQYNIEVKAGVKLINEYRAMEPHILRSFKDTYNKPILTMDLEGNDSRYSSNLTINGYIKKVRYKYWEALFNNDQFTGLLTQNLRQDFYNRIRELVDYDFSVYNIYNIKQQMNNSMVKGVEETILALFDELSHKHHWYDETSRNVHYFNGWKTNKSFKINQKVIIPLNGYHSYYADRVDYSYKVVDKLSDIEKVFNYLDGGMTRHVDINEELKLAAQYNDTKKIPLKFFNVTFFKKGTCHIEFTNEELLHKFNIFGSQHKGWLPPVYGKAKYNDMTTEEKTIIDEFEGKASYEKTINNTEYYIYDPTKTLMLEAGQMDEAV